MTISWKPRIAEARLRWTSPEIVGKIEARPNTKSLKPAKAFSADLVTDNEVVTLRVFDPVNIMPVLLRC